MQKVGENSQMVFKSVSLFGIIAATVLALASAIAVAGERDSFTTARGETIDLPAVPDLNCSEIELVLSRIDATRYRENAPAPHDSSDKPLYDYEVALAEAHFNRCVGKRGQAQGYRTLIRPSRPR